MRARKTILDLTVELIVVGHLMNKAGLPHKFIATAIETAFEFEGVYDLMKIWMDENVQTELDKMVGLSGLPLRRSSHWYDQTFDFF